MNANNYVMDCIDERIPLSIKNLILIRFQIITQGFKLALVFLSYNKNEYSNFINKQISSSLLEYWLLSPIINNSSRFLITSVKFTNDNRDSSSKINLGIEFTEQLSKVIFNHKRIITSLIMQLYSNYMAQLNTNSIKNYFLSLKTDIANYYLVTSIAQRQENKQLLSKIKNNTNSYFILGIFPIINFLITLITLDSFESLHEYETYIDVKGIENPLSDP